MTIPERVFERPEILIVALEPETRRALSQALVGRGYDVAQASSATEARDTLERRTFELVLVDASGGGFDPRALCAHILALPSGAVTAVVARVAQATELEGACRDGAWDAVLASADDDELDLRLERALRRRDDAIERLATETALALSQDAAVLGAWSWSPGAPIVLSGEAVRVLGLDASAERLTREQWLERVSEREREGARQWLDQVLAGGDERELEFGIMLGRSEGEHEGERRVRAQARLVPGLSRRAARVVGTVQDLTARHVAEQEVRYLAEHDVLTGLANRAQFLERLEASIREIGERGGRLAVLCVELDRFKAIAGGASSRAGDELLVAVARRLREGLRDSDVLARLGCRVGGTSIARIGGDEFTVLLDGLVQVEDAAKIGRRLLELLAEPFALEDREVFVSSSVGVATCPGDSQSADELVRGAETAAYCARQQGPNTLSFHTPAMNARAFERLTLETSLRRALERDELLLHYQPRVDIATGRVVGMEALVRWRHPELGLVSPGQFIPLAEETGLIVPIGEWVLARACEQNRRWQDEGLPPIRIAVNLSSVQFRQPDLYESITRVVRASRLDPRWLELELTESLLMQNAVSAVATLERLKGLGIHLSIDDFGTGYSSLAYLKRFPIDALKIDQSFVRDLTTNPDDAAIATAILLMGKGLKLRVVAEGIETPSQLSFLRVMHCDEGQGFLFSPPVPAEEAARFMSVGSRAESAA